MRVDAHGCVGSGVSPNSARSPMLCWRERHEWLLPRVMSCKDRGGCAAKFTGMDARTPRKTGHYAGHFDV